MSFYLVAGQVQRPTRPLQAFNGQPGVRAAIHNDHNGVMWRWVAGRLPAL